MTLPEQPVPGSEGSEVSPDVITDEMLGTEGVAPVVPVETPPAPEVMPGQEPVDATALKSALEETRKELEDLKSRSAQDMDSLRSTLDRSRSAALSEKDAELEAAEARMHAAVTANLDEADALKYTQQVQEQKIEMLKNRLAQADARSEAMVNMDSWTRGFMQMGVRYDQIDRSSPETCIQTGYAAIEANRQGDLAKITEMENTIRQLQAAKEAGTPPGTTPVTPRAPEAPPTLGTQTGTAPSQVKTIGQLLTSLESQLGYKVSEDEMWSMINSGQLSQNILSGLLVP